MAISPVASVLIQVDDKEYKDLVKGAMSYKGKRDRANALGLMVEEMTKSVFGGTGFASTAGGKADVQNIPVKNFGAIAKTIGDTTTVGILTTLKEDAVDIEAKATERPIGVGEGRGIIKVSQVTPGAGGQLSDADYVNRAKLFIIDVLKMGALGHKAPDVERLFASADFTQPGAQAKFRKALAEVVDNDTLEAEMQKIINTNKSGFLNGPFSNLIRTKTKNLTVQINAQGPGGNYRFFQTFLNLPITPKDIDIAHDKGRYSKSKKRHMSGTFKFFFTSKFEKYIIEQTKDKLRKGAAGIVSGAVLGGKGGRRVIGFNFSGVKKANPFTPALLDGLDFTVVIPTGGSIPIPGGLRILPFYSAIRKEVRKAQARSKPSKEAKRGKFISNVQLSAILRQKLTEIMPRYPEPQRPTPRYITGKLANSFRVMANYRTGVMAFYNTPPASEYVDQLNSDGWMLDETLVEPTIRQITQERFGRQFRVLRTQ